MLLVAQVTTPSPWAFHLHVDAVALGAFLLLGYAYLWRTHGRTFHPRPDDPAVTPRQAAMFVAGVVIYYLSVGWPLHDIAERYLYSAHMLQHVLLGFVAVPLILLGVPEWMARIALGRGALVRQYRWWSRPIVALVAYNATLAFIHWPLMVDLMLASEALHVAIHLVFLIGTLLAWSVVCSPLPEIRSLTPPAKMAFLFGLTVLPTIPASFLTFGDSVLYHAYETTPRLWGLSPRDDMQLAGLIMKVGVGIFLWSIIAIIFFRWVADEERRDLAARRGGGDDSGPDSDGWGGGGGGGSRPDESPPGLGPRPTTTSWSGTR